MHYNFARPHKTFSKPYRTTLRRRGVRLKVWTLSEIVGLIQQQPALPDEGAGDLANKGDKPNPTLHVSVFIPGRMRGSLVFRTEVVPLTPQRVKLLAKLIELDKQPGPSRSKPSNWAEVEAALSRYFGQSH